MKMTKEMRDNIITVLYEKCANGEISIDQRELLIQKANSALITEDVETETDLETEATNIVESTELSPKEKYDAFKTLVYEKCAEGELTEDEREDLLVKAVDRFLTISE